MASDKFGPAYDGSQVEPVSTLASGSWQVCRGRKDCRARCGCGKKGRRRAEGFIAALWGNTLGGVSGVLKGGRKVKWIRICYLDTSALIKLVIDEPETGILDDFLAREIGTRFNTTWLCVAEALGVLKRQWLQELKLCQTPYEKTS